MADIAKLDLYGLLDISQEATEKQILKAYRKKALKCHPDKNPDNPRAAEEFHQLSKALEVLTDAAARAAYDKIQKAKKAAAQRHRELDSKRKKAKEDLEAREQAHEQQKVEERTAARNLEQEIERLRKEGSRLLEEEQEKLREELEQGQQKQDADLGDEGSQATPRLKVKWKAKKSDNTNGGYSDEVLHRIFDKYGEVTALLVSSQRNGSAIIEFSSPHSALMAVQNESGLSENPLTLTWISGKPIQQNACDRLSTSAGTGTSFDAYSSSDQAPSSSERDYESIVLMKMRQLAERQRLIQQMQEEDEGT